MANAAASNAGPRLAEVAGRARRSERSEDVGREGIVHAAIETHGRAAISRLKQQKIKGSKPIFVPAWGKSSRFQPIRTSKLCLIHECAANCYEFLWKVWAFDMLIAQKWAGSNNPGAPGGLTIRCLKHAAWQNHVCHFPLAVDTCTRHGSTSEG